MPTGLWAPAPGEPRRIGAFRVAGRLGAGGMGVVYAALDDADRRVAVNGCTRRSPRTRTSSTT